MYKLLLFLGTILSLLSCMDSREKEVMTLLNEWVGKEILYPKNLLICNDSSGNSLESKYKVFIYTDSLGCVSCKLNLAKWRTFISMVDSVAPGNVRALFVFQPKRINELRMLLKNENFSYSLYIDKDDQFNKLNHFPSKMEFQTFLLDKDNKVLAIGNPVLNPKVKELYLKIIQGKPLQDDSKDKQVMTTVSLESTVLSMGDFSWQEERQGTFRLKNTGEKPLVIQDVVTSCGCLTVDYPQEPVQPGKEAVLRMTYKADSPGYFNKVVTVYCNAEDSPIRLRVSGNALEKG